MSFLGSIVNSIGGDRAPPPPPPKPLNKPAPFNPARAPVSGVKNAPRPTAHNSPPLSAGLKRKAEDDGAPSNAKTSRSNTPNTTACVRTSSSPYGNTALQKSGVSSLASKPKPTGVQLAKPLGTTPKAAPSKPAPSTSKPPLKGSYAEMMARAKQSAEQRANNIVGIIKHQETKKEKMSRLAERRKAGQDASKQSKSVPGLKKEDKAASRGSSSPTKNETTASAKVKAPAKPTYKGTMGLGASQSRPPKSAQRKSRYDEYLGTDEEDDDIIDYDDDDGYGSGGSSEMEAGFDDVEDEEAMALRAAKEDDARELALESQLKREKEERRKKLLGLAKKQR